MIYFCIYFVLGLLTRWATSRMGYLEKSERLADFQDWPAWNKVPALLGEQGWYFSMQVMLWPIVATYAAMAWWEKRSRNPVFHVRPWHLGQRLTVAETEEKEMVFDPLGAVPLLPFGHLNMNWKYFRQTLADDDFLYAFDVVWRVNRLTTERRTGYARVRFGWVVSFFVDQIIETSVGRVIDD